ncbi:radical SAM protein [Desulfolithobacter sp.]
MALVVNEIFYSIQGESTYAGLPCIFVRLTGCNLRCAYCDTRYAFSQGRPMTLEEIEDLLRLHRCSLVEITGGEPLLQDETPELVRRLLERGYRVLLETNGSLDISRVDSRCIRIMDLKCPSSGEVEQNDLENLHRLTPGDEVKFVLGDRDDYEWARDMVRRVRPVAPPGTTILFSAIADQLDHATLARWIIEDNLGVRLQVQLHKIIWAPDTRGV